MNKKAHLSLGAIRSHKEVASELGISEAQSVEAETTALHKLWFLLKEHAGENGYPVTQPVALKGQPQSGRPKPKRPRTKDHWGRPLKKSEKSI